MSEKGEVLSLETLEGGGAVELVDNAIKDALENIHDINTTLDARKVILEIVLKPLDENRGVIVHSVKCNKKFAGQATLRGSSNLNVENGKLVARIRPKVQLGLPGSNVTSLVK